MSPEHRLLSGFQQPDTEVVYEHDILTPVDLHTPEQVENKYSLAWAMEPHHIDVFVSETTEHQKRMALMQVVSDVTIEMADYLCENHGLVRHEFPNDFGDPDRRNVWLEAVSGYAERAHEANSRYELLGSIKPIGSILHSAVSKLDIASREEYISDMEEVVRRTSIHPEALEILQQKLGDKYNKLLTVNLGAQVEFLKGFDKDYTLRTGLFANLPQAEPTIQPAQHIEQEAVQPDSKTLPEAVTTESSQLESEPLVIKPSFKRELLNTSVATATSVATQLAEKLKASEIPESIREPHKHPKKAVVWIAVLGAAVCIAKPSHDTERASTETLIELAEGASESQWGEPPSGISSVALGIPKGAEGSAAAGIYSKAIRSKNSKLLDKSVHILNTSPLTIAARHNLDPDDIIKPKLRGRYVNNSVEYMRSLVRMTHFLGEAHATAVHKDPKHKPIIDRLLTMAEFSLKRIKDEEVDITPAQLNAASEQFSNAITAALYPGASVDVWKDEQFDSKMESALREILQDALFKDKDSNYTDEQKDLIANFLARGISLASPDQPKEIKESIQDSKEAAINIQKFGVAAGKKAFKIKKMKKFHGLVIPPPTSKETTFYKFFVKRFIEEDGFKPHAAKTAAAGGIGSTHIESDGFRCITCMGGGGNKFYGIWQLSYDIRFLQLQDFAEERDLNYETYKTQLKFGYYDLKHNYRQAFEMLMSDEYSAADKAMIWGRYYEIAVDYPSGILQMEAERRTQAKAFMDFLEEFRQTKLAERQSGSNQNFEKQGWEKYVTDLGIKDTYINGELVKQRLYAVHDIVSFGEESEPGSAYYVEGANGKAIVSEQIVAKIVAMARAAKKDGVTLSVTSSWRTHEHQTILYAGRSSEGSVAEPGHSNHQSGLALDYNLDGYEGSIGNPSAFPAVNPNLAVSPANPVWAPGSRMWRWLDKHGWKYDQIMLYFEAWHYSANGG